MGIGEGALPRGRRVRVEAPARLHFGFVDMDGGLGRRFGSLGMAIDGHRVRVAIGPAETLIVDGAGERAADFARACCDTWNIPPALRLTIDDRIPAHCGLGSGTQLALAIGAAIAGFAGRPIDAREIAGRLDRGARSGVGIGAFEQGGFIVDGGNRIDAPEPPPTIARLPFPAAWRIVMILDPAATGLHGPAEIDAFRRLPPFSAALAGELSRLVLMRILPSLAEHDLDGFGDGLGELQARIGDHFAPVQGGRFTSPRVARALEGLRRLGARALGQSSWGPTGFAIGADVDEAERWLSQTAPECDERLQWRIITGRNHGASVEFDDHPGDLSTSTARAAGTGAASSGAIRDSGPGDGPGHCPGQGPGR